MMMISASFAWGQEVSANGMYLIHVNVKATNPTTHIDYQVNNATIEYRWKSGNLNGLTGTWQDWRFAATANVDGYWITFPTLLCEYTNGTGQQMEYVIRAYKGSLLIKSTCGIVDIDPTPNVPNNIIVTSWNSCPWEVRTDTVPMGDEY